MKRITLLTAIAMIGFTVSTFGQVSATAEAAATIVEPLTIEKVQNLNFGIFATSADETTVIVAADGSNSGTAESMGGSTAAAKFTVTGQENETYKVSLPDEATLRNQIGEGGETMKVTEFVSSLETSNEATITSGDNGFSVGATLTVGANQEVGDYTGDFEVTVQYL